MVNMAGRTKRFRGWLFLIAAVLLGSTLFVTPAENPPVVEVIPQELDVRAAGGVLRGGSLPVTAPGADAPANQSAVRALAQSRAVDAAQTKALQSLTSPVTTSGLPSLTSSHYRARTSETKPSPSIG